MSMRSSRLVSIAVLATLLACGCASPTAERYGVVVREASTNGFVPVRFGASPPVIGMLRTQHQSQRLWVVIEGDGHAWLSVREPSSDPTPIDAVGWRLAQHVAGNAVLYLARPCQYLSQTELESCSVNDWTDARFSEKLVARLNAAIDEAKRTTHAASIVVTGYSGGGVMAALIAARRDDVAGLVTVAAPLDHSAWAAYHGVAQLTGSLSVVAVRQKLFHVPQVHIVGESDTNVPPVLMQNFLRAYPKGAPVRMIVMPGLDHRMRAEIDLAHVGSAGSSSSAGTEVNAP
jgi:dienelactone hydrolase